MEQGHQPDHGEMPCLSLEERFLPLLTDYDLLAVSSSLLLIYTYHLRPHCSQYWAPTPHGLGFDET